MFCPNCGHENSNENKYCMKCGKDIKKESESFNADTYNKGNNLGGNYSGQNNNIPPYIEKIIAKYDSIYSRGSKIIRLVVGIISIVLSLFISFQSCAAEVGNAFFSPDSYSGFFGLVLSVLWLASGIVAIAARKTRGGTITSVSMYLLAALITNVDVGVFKDLIVWSKVSWIFAVLLIISLAMKEDKEKHKKYSLDVVVLSIISAIVILFMIIYRPKASDITSKNIFENTESQITSQSDSKAAEEIKENTGKTDITNNSALNDSEMKSYDSIIPGCYIGMSQSEMLDVIGYNYDEKITSESASYWYDDDRIIYNYVVNSVPSLECNMKAVMFFEFSNEDRLFNYGYHIGWDLDKYYYDRQELVKAYDEIYNLLKSEYNAYLKDDSASYSYADSGVIKANTGYLGNTAGDLWFVVGTDLWSKNSGVNEISVSCSNESLKTPLEDEEEELINGVSYPIEDTKGQINCHGGIVPGYKTSYVCDGGACETVRQSLGDTWHVTAKNVCVNYGITWCELWDSDDGDYYGWVDADYIDFY